MLPNSNFSGLWRFLGARAPLTGPLGGRQGVTIMRALKIGAIGATALGLLTLGVFAQERAGVLPANDLTWKAAPTSFPQGAEFAPLYGDPSKGGPFVMRIRLPAGYKIAPHKHSAAETLTILSGELRYGTGDTYDPAVETFAHALDFIVTPAEAGHWVQANADTVLQLSSIGPFTMTYLNPQDDPRTAQR